MMKQYLSFGCGVNSVALLLFLLDRHEQFESVFVDHQTDWPETYEYLYMLQDWLKAKGYPAITVLNPSVTGFSSLFDYAWHYKMVPMIKRRWCTSKFKVQPLIDYCDKPSFQLLGISFEESHRAKFSSVQGLENRYPLIEHEIDRAECIEIIKAHGLPVPIKSGCFICPFQKASKFKELRRVHPDYFCKAERLENRVLASTTYKITINPRGKTLGSVINQDENYLFTDLDYPPCQCGD